MAGNQLEPGVSVNPSIHTGLTLDDVLGMLNRACKL